MTLSSGQKLDFDPDGIYVIVGPNNSGKSTFIHELDAYAKTGFSSLAGAKVFKDITFVGSDNFENYKNEQFESELLKYLEPFNSNNQPYLRGYNVSVHRETAWARLRSFQSGLHEMAPMFCRLVGTNDRLSIVSPPSTINVLETHPTHPIQMLYANDNLEAKVNSYVKHAFGKSLIVNRGAGNVIPIHLGEPPKFDTGEDRVSRGYLERLGKLPQLSKQGDGVKSFVGTLMLSTLNPAPITLVDEPEAFLHPPQARFIGKALGDEFTSESQLFIATHSGDVLRGLLDSSCKKVHVIRITRDGEVNKVNLLSADDVKRLWDDSILRFSNILDGLFHESVILCESDSDCRFFSAIFENEVAKKLESKRPAVMFNSTGGKDRFPVVINALKKLNVSTKVVADFDVLSDEKKASEIVSALGGDWIAFQPSYNVCTSALTSKTPPLSANQASDRIDEITKEMRAKGTVTKEHKEAINRAVKATSRWAAAKESGITAFPAGEPTVGIKKIVDECKNFGFYINPDGELESFDRTINDHGPSWAAAALAKSLDDISFSKAVSFVKSFVGLS